MSISSESAQLPGPVVKQVDQDDGALEAIGVHRELRREFTPWATFSFALSIFGCVSSIASTFNSPILLGGPASAIWAWFLGSWGMLVYFVRMRGDADAMIA